MSSVAWCGFQVCEKHRGFGLELLAWQGLIGVYYCLTALFALLNTWGPLGPNLEGHALSSQMRVRPGIRGGGEDHTTKGGGRDRLDRLRPPGLPSQWFSAPAGVSPQPFLSPPVLLSCGDSSRGRFFSLARPGESTGATSKSTERGASTPRFSATNCSACRSPSRRWGLPPKAETKGFCRPWSRVGLDSSGGIVQVTS